MCPKEVRERMAESLVGGNLNANGNLAKMNKGI